MLGYVYSNNSVKHHKNRHHKHSLLKSGDDRCTYLSSTGYKLKTMRVESCTSNVVS